MHLQTAGQRRSTWAPRAGARDRPAQPVTSRKWAVMLQGFSLTIPRPSPALAAPQRCLWGSRRRQGQDPGSRRRSFAPTPPNPCRERGGPCAPVRVGECVAAKSQVIAAQIRARGPSQGLWLHPGRRASAGEECQGTGALVFSGASPQPCLPRSGGLLTGRWPLAAEGSSKSVICSLYFLWKFFVQSQPHAQSPYRLVVRTSRCGRDNPGSTPGEDICAMFSGQSLCCMNAESKKHIQVYLLPCY